MSNLAILEMPEEGKWGQSNREELDDDKLICHAKKLGSYIFSTWKPFAKAEDFINLLE